MKQVYNLLLKKQSLISLRIFIPILLYEIRNFIYHYIYHVIRKLKFLLLSFLNICSEKIFWYFYYIELSHTETFVALIFIFILQQYN